jgi:hypothetical protein
MPNRVVTWTHPGPSRTYIMQTNNSANLLFPQPAEQPGDTTSSTLPALFHQLSQALTVLSSTAELLSDGRSHAPPVQTLRMWLQPNARQAEDAMHRLRNMRLAKTSAATELSQCLTVLVLAADMLINGQLTGSGAQETYDLLRRNADRAMKSLVELRAQILPDM